jgi:hypothetical protein
VPFAGTVLLCAKLSGLNLWSWLSIVLFTLPAGDNCTMPAVAVLAVSSGDCV